MSPEDYPLRDPSVVAMDLGEAPERNRAYSLDMPKPSKDRRTPSPHSRGSRRGAKRRDPSPNSQSSRGGRSSRRGGSKRDDGSPRGQNGGSERSMSRRTKRKKGRDGSPSCSRSKQKRK